MAVAPQVPDVMVTRLDKLASWCRKNRLWPMPFATACCGIELMATHYIYVGKITGYIRSEAIQIMQSCEFAFEIVNRILREVGVGAFVIEIETQVFGGHAASLRRHRRSCNLCALPDRKA